MSSIPEEIYHEILLRLPVKSLLICKSVCKNWYALISTSDFIKLHLHLITQKNNPILILEGSDDNVLNSIGYDSLASSVCEIEDAAIEMDYPYKSLHDAVRLVGSCNGLVCIRFCDDGDDCDGDFLCLWNPATREYKEIPKSPIKIGSNINALGYDHRTDDYKLLIGAGRSNDSTLVQFYTLASDSWKPGQAVPYRFPYFAQQHGVFVNGDLHWLAIAQGKFFLLSLDISDESFKDTQLLPKELLEENKKSCIVLGVLEESMTMGVLEGCLCVIVNSYANGVINHCQVWEMLNYGVIESWTRRHIITHGSIIRERIKFLSPMWFLKNGTILFTSSGRLILYNREHGSARTLRNINNFTRLALNYFESLVSLKSGTYVGGERPIEELREI